MFIILLSFLISFILVALMLPRVLLLSLRKRLIDPIDDRKVHCVPASRLGGLTFFPALLFSVLFCIALTQIIWPLLGFEVHVDIKLISELLALFSLYMIGVYDDVLGATYKQKFAVQLFAALLIVASGTYFKTLHGIFGVEDISIYIGVPLTIFIYVFITNAINLIDGIDGLASIISILALFVYGILLFANAQLDDSIIAFATMGALVPFCYLNVFGVKRGAASKIFMGDTGALVIGAVLGFMAVKIWNISYMLDGVTPVNQVFYTLAYTMLIVPCFDVIRVVFNRFRRGKPLFLPDKNHIHHKLIALGCTAKRALTWIIVINIFFLALNLLLSSTLDFVVIVAIDVVIWTVMHIMISKAISKDHD